MRARLALAVVVALAWGVEASAQIVRAPEELPGFSRRRTDDGRTWWHRRVEGWDYFATPTQDVWNHPPLSIVDASQIPTRNFGVNLQAWRATGQASGFTSGGGSQSASFAADSDPSSNVAPPEPEAAEADPIALWCRRRGVPEGTAYGALGFAGSLILFVLSFLVRRFFRR